MLNFYSKNEILEYITSELCSPQAAENTVGCILDAVDRLEDFAELDMLLSAVTDVESDYRFLVIGNYMAFYHVYDISVYIDRVLYGKRDYLRILFPSERLDDQDE
mgnify:CR=1 FL=1